MAEPFIHMGTLARPHGIRGEICIDWFADFSLVRDAPIWLQAGKQPPRPVHILSCRFHKGRPIILLEGILDRNAAEGLRGQKLLMARKDLPPLADDEVYVEDLLGCMVTLPDGLPLGRLAHIEYPAGQEIWAIDTEDGKEILFPAQPCFITGFDLESRTLQIDPPEGLLDIYLS